MMFYLISETNMILGTSFTSNVVVDVDLKRSAEI